ncbi:hypothetical protein [Bacillus alkalicellulosilyticus]|uniref:hypothetical protein n=1 Tax=Alkalihalobacterium alkalicellulosilyticum TaxID=1912214 RepID=UPI0009985845|nr:hypothetical protein [Bacillus alkalicellulosilyticus]
MRLHFIKVSFIVVVVSLFILTGCSTTPEEEAQEPNNLTEIHLTEQLKGVFKGYADGDQVIITDKDGVDEYYLITDTTIGDLEIIEEGETINYSFTTTEEGRLALETIRKGD